jgi:drug/metabolite transporter (DMT)-like permease
MESRPHPLALPALLAGAACIGIAPLWVRFSELGPNATGAHRLILALPFLTVWWWLDRRQSPEAHGPSTRAEWGWFAAAGLLFAADLWAWHLSIHRTSLANASLLPNLAPAVVALGSHFWLRERITPGFMAGFAVALLGAAVLVGVDWTQAVHLGIGDAFGLLTAVFYGGYQFCVKVLRRTRPVSLIMLASGPWAAVPLLGLALWQQESLWPGSAKGWGMLLGLALTAQVAGQSLIAFGFAHLPGGTGSLTLLFQPVIGVVCGWLLLGESLGLRQALGALLVLAGLVWARSRPTPRPAT